MNPFVAWLSLMGSGGFRACDCGAFTVVAPEGEVFPWTRTDGQAALTRKPASAGVRIGSDRTLLNQRASQDRRSRLPLLP
ncbi:MAG: hypothetical protein CL998_00515, partial [Euryarchaeota archaeon]|nr:hypothetical protein [Euryarchaeota archaeon]